MLIYAYSVIVCVYNFVCFKSLIITVIVYKFLFYTFMFMSVEIAL